LPQPAQGLGLVRERRLGPAPAVDLRLDALGLLRDRAGIGDHDRGVDPADLGEQSPQCRRGCVRRHPVGVGRLEAGLILHLVRPGDHAGREPEGYGHRCGIETGELGELAEDRKVGRSGPVAEDEGLGRQMGVEGGQEALIARLDEGCGDRV
jgi:hypothetical protein